MLFRISDMGGTSLQDGSEKPNLSAERGQTEVPETSEIEILARPRTRRPSRSTRLHRIDPVPAPEPARRARSATTVRTGRSPANHQHGWPSSSNHWSRPASNPRTAKAAAASAPRGLKGERRESGRLFPNLLADPGLRQELHASCHRCSYIHSLDAPWHGFFGGLFLDGVRPHPLSNLDSADIFSGSVQAEAAAQFLDITDAVGLYDFRHDSGGIHSIEDVVAPGLGLLDLDGDEDLDLVLLGGLGQPTGVSIFLNQLRETERLEFVDATERLGIHWRGQAQGVCAGDYNNDQTIDLLITAVGQNLLLKGVYGLETKTLEAFVDATAEAGVGGASYFFAGAEDRQGPGTIGELLGSMEQLPQSDPISEFSTGASFGDYDGDGDLDLMVANYVSVHPQLIQPRLADDPLAQYRAANYPPQKNRLYQNRGDGTFREVTELLGAQNEPSRSLDAMFVQIDMGRWPDLYVANQTSANRLYLNQSTARTAPAFAEFSDALGIADARSSAGFARGDVDSDGDLDLVVNNGHGEPSSMFLAFYQSDSLQQGIGRTHFEDRGTNLGVANDSQPWSGRGIQLVDYDNDGYQDLIIANGSAMPAADGLTCRPETVAVVAECCRATLCQCVRYRGSTFSAIVQCPRAGRRRLGQGRRHGSRSRSKQWPGGGSAKSTSATLAF